MATAYRQPIWPGDQGSDVKAVKRSMVAMKVPDYEQLKLDNVAGGTFVRVLNGVLRSNHLPQDGKYGPKAHAIFAPHFDLYGVSLYKKAQIRDHSPQPDIAHESAQQAAKQLLDLAREGRYRADNPGDMTDIERTAAGLTVWSRGGRWIRMDARPLQVLVWLIKTHNYRLGTFALCSDHHFDGWHGHSGGFAVDISSINGISISGAGAHEMTRAVANVLRNAPSPFRPRQLITAGSGYVYYQDCLNLCLPSAGYYDQDTLAGHRNHIHVGY